MKNIYFYFKLCVMMFAFFLMQSTQADTRLRAILKPADHHSFTYEFYNGDINDDANLVQTQIVLNEEKLLIPAIPVPVPPAEPSGAFIGWFEEGATEAFSFSNPINVTETKTVKLRARYSDKVYVHFIVKSINEEAGLKVATTKEVKKGETVNVDDIPIIYPVGKMLTHWAITPEGVEAYDFATAVNENISLYAVYKPAWRVYFRMRGGKSILPRYYGDNDPLNPSGQITPDRAGYTFKGWTKVDPGTTSDDAIISDFGINAPVNEDLVLYALWDKGSANYKVAHWQQNADDDGYSFVEIDEKSGTTESEALYEAKDYLGFTLNAEKSNYESKIDGFGTTVKHVFYDRKMYTLSFTKTGEEPKKFENIRYGAKTDEQWNQIAAANPNHLFSITGNSGSPFYYTHPPRMWNKDSHIKVEPTKGEEYIVYYRDEDEPQVDVLPPFKFNYTQPITSAKLKLHIDGTSVAEGFEQVKYSSENDDRLKFFKNAENVFVATRYFTRNKYKITFFKKNGDSKEAVVGEIPFQAPLDGKALPEFEKGVTPRESDNFIFGGWFTAEETQDGAEEFVFEGKEMPAHNIALYAKWVKPTYTVYFHPNNDKTSIPYASIDYEHNSVITEEVALEKVSALTDPLLFFKWFWYPSLDRYVRYDFGMPITQDVHLYPTWKHDGFTVTYHVVAGEGTAPVDENKYFVGKDAIVKQKTDDMVHTGGKVFIGWKLKSMSGSSEVRAENRLYIPGEKIVVDKDITLYDWWEDKPQMTKIIYKANGGVGADITEDLMNNQTHVTKAKETFTKAGKEIKSWNTQPGGGGATFEPGVSIIVNNNPETPNELYAIWGNTTGVNTVASNLTIKLYPNPVLTTLNIEGEQIISRVEILDALGKFVQVIDGANSKHLRSDLSNLSPGLYYVKVFSNNEKTVFKVIKK